MKKLAYTALVTGAVALMSSGVMAAGQDDYTQNRDMYRQQQSGMLGNQYSTMEPAAGGEQLSQSQVRNLQQNLQQRGFNPGPVDGILGPQTRDAIRQFQQANNLDSTGQLNQETATRLGMAGTLGDTRMQQDNLMQRDRDRMMQNDSMMQNDNMPGNDMRIDRPDNTMRSPGMGNNPDMGGGNSGMGGRM